MGKSTVILACGALVADLKAVMAANRLDDQFEIQALPANLHNQPERIAPLLEEKLAKLGDRRVVIAYADCGSKGEIDKVCQRHQLERLPGDHCYDAFAGAETIKALLDEEPGTFFLTDYMVRYFDGLIYRGMGLDRYPQLRDTYFAAYRRIVYLAQTHDAKLREKAEDCAHRLGLPLEVRPVGFGALAEMVQAPRGDCSSAG